MHPFINHPTTGNILEYKDSHGYTLQIIPVIDLMNGSVVHARHGDRAHYRPLRSTLSDSNQPRQVVDALLRLHAFQTLYIADLDAILRRGDNWQSIRAISRHYPFLALWIDAGLRGHCDIAQWRLTGSRTHIVVGSESLPDTRLLNHPLLRNTVRYAVLSLDFQGETFLGPAELATDTFAWPEHVIIMTLERVGSRQGPNLDRLRQLTTLSPTTAWYMGGGVRSVDDLHTLNAQGISGVLIASALHNGAISSADLAAFTS